MCWEVRDRVISGSGSFLTGPVIPLPLTHMPCQRLASRHRAKSHLARNLFSALGMRLSVLDAAAPDLGHGMSEHPCLTLAPERTAATVLDGAPWRGLAAGMA
jgi:hypothetical protein